MSETEHIHMTRPGSIRKVDGLLKDSRLGSVHITADDGGTRFAFYDPEGRPLPFQVHLYPHTMSRDIGGEIRDSLLRSINYHLNN